MRNSKCTPLFFLQAIVLIIAIQIVFSLLVFHPYIIQWGATAEEVKMPLLGDDYGAEIRSTRGIVIHASKEEVWDYLVNLGADRSGFYSYYFLEYLFGCKWDANQSVKRSTIEINRLVPIKSKDASGNYTVGFKVVALAKQKALVLQDWGTFYITEISNNKVKLLIRTHGKKNKGLIRKLGSKLFDGLHYMMERRMLLGIKDIAESNGENYTLKTDTIWFFSMLLCILIGIKIFFILIGIYSIPTGDSLFTYKGGLLMVVSNLIFFSIQCFVLVVDPTAYLGIILVSILIGFVFLIRNKLAS